jgi:hypothetical protein
MEPDARTFFEPPAAGFPDLADIVRDEMDRLRRRSMTQVPRSDCLFSSVQSYLLLLVALLPKLAHHLAKGPHANDYINIRASRGLKLTDYSELEPVDALCQQQSSLVLVFLFYLLLPPSAPLARPAVDPGSGPRASQFVAVLQRFSDEISSEYQPTTPQRPSTAPPGPPPSHHPQPDVLFAPFSLDPPLQNPPSPNTTSVFPASFSSPNPLQTIPANPEPGRVERVPDVRPASPDIMQQEDAYGDSSQSSLPSTPSPSSAPSPSSQLSTDIDIPEGLNRRGKGLYTCPLVPTCRKGGVKADGSPVYFEQNSAFLSVLFSA